MSLNCSLFISRLTTVFLAKYQLTANPIGTLCPVCTKQGQLVKSWLSWFRFSFYNLNTKYIFSDIMTSLNKFSYSYCIYLKYHHPQISTAPSQTTSANCILYFCNLLPLFYKRFPEYLVEEWMHNCGFSGGSTRKFSGALEFLKSPQSPVFQVGMIQTVIL